MKTHISLNIILFLALTAVSLPASGPESSAFNINSHVKALYDDLLSKTDQQIPLSGDVEALISNLLLLRDLDPDIRALAPGILDSRLRKEANLYRAMAWLHSWAVFSRLATASGTPIAPPDLRMRLVQLTGDTGHLSAFRLLLIVYNQIRKEDGTAEPLRRILQDGTYFVFNLSYHEPWRNDRPASIKHAYYIPSAADLVGKPFSPPTMDRHLIGLWGLINLELDTWQDLVTQDISPELFTKLPGHQLSLHRPDGTYARIQANSNLLAPLTSWLTDIEANPDLPALEGAGSADISGLLARLHKIQMFLRVRQECADERKLSAILANINTITHQPNKDPAPAIRDLITAATPIEAGGKQEVLYDAAIWLRYLMLFSYRNEGFSAVGNGSNALAAIWTHYKLPQSFLLEPEKLGVDDSPRGAFLRWNKWPAQGSSPAVIADLTRASYTYLNFTKTISAAEDTRFKSLGAQQARRQYSDLLGQALIVFRKDAITRLEPYFTMSPSSQVDNAEPISLVDPDSPQTYSFKYTSTPNEQTRWVDDLSSLYSQAVAEYKFNDLILSTYKTSDPSLISSVLQNIGGTEPTSGWNIYSLPTKTFSDYDDELRNALKDLGSSIKEFEADAELRSLFQERQQVYENAQVAVSVARLGREVAAHALAIDQTYRKIADLDIQIADLEKKISEFDLQGYKSKEQADAVRLEYDTRLRDLAAGKVEALVAASEQANELVEKATSDLGDLKQKLLNSVDQIRSAKDHAKVMSIVNSVVTVVGFALAPFTGGSSIAIAATVNKAVTLLDKVQRTDWSKLPNAIATVQDVGAFLSQDLKLTSVPVPAQLQHTIEDCNKFFGSAKSTIEQMSAPAKDLITSIQRLGNKDEVNRYVSALASGIPLVFDSRLQTIKVNLSKETVVISSPPLQAAVSRVIEAGGILVNDARSRSERFSKLVTLSGPDLTDELKKSVDDLVRPLPESFVLPGDIAHTKGTLEDARKAFREAIGQLDAASQSGLAQMLANGVIFVRGDDKRIFAVQKAFNDQVEAFKDRLQRYEHEVKSAAIEGVAKNISAIAAGVNAEAQQLVDKQDDDGLATYATQTLPARIDTFREELSKLQDQVKAARDGLEDQKTEVSIASYNADAAHYFVQSAELRGEAAALQARKVGFSLDAAALRVEESLIEGQRQEALVEMALRSEDIARASMQRTYFTCLARGFNPMAGASSGRVDYQFGSSSIRSLLAGSADTADVHSDLMYSTMAGSLAGMIRWVYLLRLNSPAETENLTSLYLMVIRAMQARDVGSVKTVAERLRDKYASREAKALRPTGLAKASRLTKEVLWLGDLPEADRATWLLPIIPELQKRILGVAQISFSLDTTKNSKTVVVPRSLGDSSYYMKLENVHVVREGVPSESGINTSNLYFVLVPPANPMGNPSELMAGLSKSDSDFISEGGHLTETLQESEWMDAIGKQVSPRKWATLHLSGAIGTWTFYIYSSTDVTPDELGKLKSWFQVTLWMPYLEVKHAAN